MRVLLLTTKFSTNAASPWLTNELAETMRDSGHEVTVLCLDWSSAAELGAFNINGIRVFNYPAVSYRFIPASLGKVIKWFVSSILAYRYFKHSLRGLVFDALVSFSPCVPVWFCILKFRRYAVKRVVIYWDFFPIHSYQIGKIRSRFLLKPAFLIEKYLLSKFDAAGCMSGRNIEFFRNYFSLGVKIKLFELPIWGRMPLVGTGGGAEFFFDRSQYNYKKLVIFGGQLELGRGIDKLLQLSKELKLRNENIALVIAGDGPLRSSVLAASQDGTHNLIFLGKLPRNDYLKFIRTCDIGIISTQTNVSVPTYPSKCIDYLLAPLPIVVIVEQATDFGDIIQKAGCGLVCTSGGIGELADKIVYLANNDLLTAQMRLACPVFFDSRHNVVNVAKQLVNELVSS